VPIDTNLVLGDDLDLLNQAPLVVLIGRKGSLQASGLASRLGVAAETWTAMLDPLDGGDGGASTSTFVGTRQVVIGLLPEPCSRHNSPSRAWAIPGLAARAGGRQDAVIALVLAQDEHDFASCLAVARAFPPYTQASGRTLSRTVTVLAIGGGGKLRTYPRLQHGMDAVRLATRLVDAPTSVLHSSKFVEEARAVAAEVGAEITVIAGRALEEQGFGGLWSVGRTAVHPPALVALITGPADAARTVAWVGKGIVYDTGGLSLKTKTGMPGMKGDMAGAAAVLAAFRAAALAGTRDRLIAVLCIAENAVGPEATRPDDVITMKSGRTVEVNNTDAEGRLVLADGLSWVISTHKPDLCIDLATLTGAQLIATGKIHAALYANREDVEIQTIRAGLRAGEPCHPLPYAPELFRREFKSKVADMRNSVKDRENAQSSAAGQFIASHFPDTVPWVHVDIAGPAWSNERGTGFGVGLLLEMLGD
jgi:probable aminopeptidase NPEPL1